MSEIIFSILDFIKNNILAIIILILVILRTSNNIIMEQFRKQEELINKQKLLLDEQNMTLIRMLNKIEDLAEQKKQVDKQNINEQNTQNTGA